MSAGRAPEKPSGAWVSAGEVADWVYCPRAHFYRAHPPPGGEDPRAPGARASGIDYHERFLRSELRGESAGPGWWVLLAAGLALLLVAFVLLGRPL